MYQVPLRQSDNLVFCRRTHETSLKFLCLHYLNQRNLLFDLLLSFLKYVALKLGLFSVFVGIWVNADGRLVHQIQSTFGELCTINFI